MGIEVKQRTNNLARLALLVLIIVSLGRIVATYSHTAQIFDEPAHVSAGIEFLDKGTYTLDPVHPPLSRIAIGLPLYLSGVRYPALPETGPNSHNYNVVGNRILYDGGDPAHKLRLARLGVLPFFVLGAVVVYVWTRRLSNTTGALVAVFLYCTTPTILAFSSIAYTDIVAASTQLAAMFAFSLWLENPDRTTTLWLGLTLGAAFLAKLTSILFFFAAALVMSILWLSYKDKGTLHFRKRSLQILGIGIIGILIIWAGYRFSMRHVQEVTGIHESNMPTFRHFPRPVQSFARNLILRNPSIPAPELFQGAAMAWVLNKDQSESYLLGHTKVGGWWYFFLVAIAVKSPIPLLVLAAIGFTLTILVSGKSGRWKALMPSAALAGTLFVTMHLSYQRGLRHVLVTLLLLTIIAGSGIGRILELRRPARLAVAGLLAVLLFWQAGESVRAQSDFIAYFNEFVGSSPSDVLVTGCDLDCGQDLLRLADELRSRHISDVNLAVFTSADLDQSGLPHYEIPDSVIRPHGWIAVSSWPQKLGTGLRKPFPPDYFAWLQSYQPVANVGKTIRLYYVP